MSKPTIVSATANKEKIPEIIDVAIAMAVSESDAIFADFRIP